MKVHKTREERSLNCGEQLQPLFDAMARGDKISSITCMAGTTNENDSSKDFKIENFVATDYWVGMQSNSENSECYDYVDVIPADKNQKNAFYMNWVRDFTL